MSIISSSTNTNEAERLKILWQYHIMDTPPEEAFDRVTSLAARMFNVPVAMLNFVDQQRVWFKSTHGFSSSRQVERQYSLCGEAVSSVKTLVVNDTFLDPRFLPSPLFTGSKPVRFYAGAPLITGDGYALGTLCLLDFQPRSFSAEEQANLEDLAYMVMEQLEQRFKARQLVLTEANFQAVFDNSPGNMTLVSRDYTVRTFNRAANEASKHLYKRELKQGDSIYLYVHPCDLDNFNRNFHEALEGKRTCIEKNVKGLDGNDHWFEFAYNPIIGQDGEVTHVCLTILDIQERKIAQLALAQSEQRFRSLVQNSSDIIFVVEETGLIQYVSSSVEPILGYRQEELIGKSCFNLLPPAEIERASSFLAELLAHLHLLQPLEFEVLRADGTSSFLEIVGNNLLDDPNVKGIVVNSRDITGRKQTGERLHLLERAVNASPSGIVITGPLENDNKAIFVNDSFERITGYSRDEVLDRNFRFLQQGEGNQISLKEIRKALEEERNTTVTLHNYRKDGTPFWNELRLSPIRDRGGKVTHFVGIQTDITERIQAEKLLAGQKRILEMIAMGAPLPEVLTALILVIEEQDPQGLSSILLLDKNGQSLRHGIAPSLPEEYIKAIDGVSIGPEVGSCGTAVYLGQKVLVEDIATSPLWVNYRDVALSHGLRSCWAMPIFTSNGQVVGSFAFYSRKPRYPNQYELQLLETAASMAGIVIERKRIEDQQRKAAEEILKVSKLEALSLLAGGIAHDFNNILTVILGNLSLGQTYLNEKEDFLATILQGAEKATLQARDLTQQLLTFAKGGAPIKEAALLPQIIRDSVQFVMRGSGISCAFSIQEELWPVEVDKVQLSQVMQNLIINAFEAMPHGGNIKVNASNLILANQDKILPLPAGKYVCISVQDEGSGISPENLSRVFDPYFTTKERGSGLGLASCYSIIKKHDGHLAVSSEVGVGTTFYIYLPASSSLVANHSRLQQSGPLSKTGQGRVLIMDDEPLVRNVITTILQRLGYEVEAVDDGTTVINAYRDSLAGGRPFEAVIMDLTIPGGMGGREAIKKLQEINPEVRAIVSSGYSENQVMANYREYGFMGVVSKPYTVKELSKVLHQVLNEPQQASEK